MNQLSMQIIFQLKAVTSILIIEIIMPYHYDMWREI